MIDLHTHILPEVDDGAGNFEDSEKMIKAALANGISCIAATSHYSLEAEEKYDNVFSKLAGKFPEMKLLPGMEYDYDRLPEIPDGKFRTLGNSRYLLIDLKSSFIACGVKQLLFSLRMKHFKILLAHPERLWENKVKERLQEIANPEFFMQVNSGSILGLYGKAAQRAAYYLLEHGYCHVIADDAHRENGFRLAECRKKLERIYPENLLKLWFEINPQRVLKDIPLLTVMPEQSFAAKFRRWTIKHWQKQLKKREK